MSNVEQTTESSFFSRVLAALDKYFWPQTHLPDTVTQSFFRFKAFPKGIKKADIPDWVALQIKVLNPFKTLNARHFVSYAGVHVWFSRSPFQGMPETALQKPLGNGKHQVKSEHFDYSQTWRNGLMIDCICSPRNADNDISTIDNHNDYPWAVERQLDTKIKSPHFWMGIAGFAFVCVVAWVSMGHLTTSIQMHLVEQESAQLSDEVGESLAQEAVIRQTLMSVDQLQSWQYDHGSFPEAFGMIAEQLNSLGEWQPNTIRWQNSVFELEFSSQTIDIAKLVELMEQQTFLSDVNIRPHNSVDTWILEASFR